MACPSGSTIELESAPVAVMQGIYAESLARWWEHHVAASHTPLRIDLIAGGHSNLTYRVRDADGRSFALRRPPLGDLPRSAHNVLREYAILAALKSTQLPVPSVAAQCSELEVIGAPFYVMRWVDGAIIDRPALVANLLPDPKSRERAAFSLIDGLADLHSLNVDAIGLGELGPRNDYVPRQLKRILKIWDQTKTRELPIVESLHARLLARRPEQRYTGLVHADYRMGNVIFAPDATAAAVLDWELCALGDVLTDLGFLLTNWDVPQDEWPNVWMQVPPTRAGGFPDRDALVARYARRTGFNVDNLDYYRAFSYWRIAVIAEGIKRRYESGAMAEHVADSHELDRQVRARAQLADQFLRLAGG
jgi:aminoglycoside phosphotransferase (APT) family kinase protein